MARTTLLHAQEMKHILQWWKEATQCLLPPGTGHTAGQSNEVP